MGKIHKAEFIERFGEEAWKEHLRKNNESVKKWREKHPDKAKEYNGKWAREHPEENRKRAQKWQQENKEKANERKRKWSEQHSEYYENYWVEPYGKAVSMINAYNSADKKHNRGECTLTAQWMIDNIFNSKCIYCGETDWKKLGCDRIDNSLPHTPENVVCSCSKCNIERGKKLFEDFVEIKKQEHTKLFD